MPARRRCRCDVPQISHDVWLLILSLLNTRALAAVGAASKELRKLVDTVAAMHIRTLAAQLDVAPFVFMTLEDIDTDIRTLAAEMEREVRSKSRAALGHDLGVARLLRIERDQRRAHQLLRELQHLSWDADAPSLFRELFRIDDVLLLSWNAAPLQLLLGARRELFVDPLNLATPPDAVQTCILALRHAHLAPAAFLKRHGASLFGWAIAQLWNVDQRHPRVSGLVPRLFRVYDDPFLQHVFDAARRVILANGDIRHDRWFGGLCFRVALARVERVWLRRMAWIQAGKPNTWPKYSRAEKIALLSFGCAWGIGVLQFLLQQALDRLLQSLLRNPKVVLLLHFAAMRPAISGLL